MLLKGMTVDISHSYKFTENISTFIITNVTKVSVSTS